MHYRTPTLPTTEDPRPATDQGGESRELPMLLAVYPRPGVLPMPAGSEAAGRAWLERAGLTDTKVSREHLRFHRAGGRTEIEDVGSRGGTSLNDMPLPAHTRQLLADGATLRIGDTVLVYRVRCAPDIAPEEPIGELVGPFGLRDVRRGLLDIPAAAEANVLIEGDTGTGKELLAREIARRLGRTERFVPVNAATIPHDRFEADLFGWTRGSFSNSIGRNPGILLAHANGVVFFDELEALPLQSQPKLLRFLQFREVFPVGATAPEHVNITVVAATNQPLGEMVQEKSVRRDLAARFHTFLRIPSLAERPEDLFAIFASRWKALRTDIALADVPVNPDAIVSMMRHAWPENVRELDRLVRAIDPAVGLRASFVRQRLPVEVHTSSERLGPDALRATLAACDGNRTKAATRLGISRGMLLRLLKVHGIE